MSPCLFGQTQDGRDVHAIPLCGHGLRVTILTLGAILQDLRLDGIDHSLTLGRDQVADYEASYGYYGALIGPVANRIRDGQAQIGGRGFSFERNENGKTTLHSGRCGAHAKIWQIDTYSESHALLSLKLSNGDGGFPGNRTLIAEYELRPDATLRLTIRATSDADTLLNATNHSYWNLDGSDCASGHMLQIAADHYLPCDGDNLPTGEHRDVQGTEFDFRQPRHFAPGAPPLDHNFCLSDQQTALRDVLWLTGRTGVQMTLATTEPGVQVYDHRDRAPLHHGLAIEPQGWPDAPNQPGFPSITLKASETREQISEWRFRRG